MKHQAISIVGSGYVGLTTAAILANCGFTVYAVEINPERLSSIKAGKSFFYEAGVEPLLKKALEQKTLIATDSYETAIPNSSVVFSCVGTPDNADGSSNLTYVFNVATQTAELLQDGAIFVQKSTVPIGTGEKIEQLFKDTNKQVRYVSNPEFLRESTAISDTLWFDRIVAGSNDAQAAREILDLYNAIEQSRDTVAKIAGIAPPANIPSTQYIATALGSAELIKVSANAFLALKISFANSIAKLADKAHADITQVMDAVGADRRIGRAFLNAGRGYGGGCFPKDVSGLIRSAESYGVDMEIMKAASEVNTSMPGYIIQKANEVLNSSFTGKNVAVLGLAFKPGTSDVRRSPAIAIANTLAEQGAVVRAFDPQAMEEAASLLDSGIELCHSAQSATEQADCIFVATDWPEFEDTVTKAVDTEPELYIIDCMNLFKSSPLAQRSGYIGVGLGSPANSMV